MALSYSFLNPEPLSCSIQGSNCCILTHIHVSQETGERERECDVAQSCLTLCDPMDCSLPSSSVHGLFQAILLKWIAISFSKGCSQPRDRTWVSRIGRWTLYHWSHQGSPSGTLQAHIQAFWSRGITPPALGFDKIPLWLLRGVFIKCLVKATGIGPCTLLLVFLKDVPSWWISILTHNSIPY